jgi:hypothetical protein
MTEPILNDGKPHFSLREMRPIPAARGPKRRFLELMDEVEMKAHMFRKDSWNITLEVLADYLGLMQNPWKYSLPNLKWKGPISKPSYRGLEELKQKIPVELIEQYIAEAKRTPWDYPGDIFVEEELAGRANRMGQCLTPRCIVDFMLKAMMGEKAEKKPYSYAKPDVSTLMWQTAEALDFNDQLPINLLAERARRHTVLGMRPLLVKYEPEPITQLDPCVGTGRFLLGSTLMYPKAPLLLYGIEIDLSLYRACLVNLAMFSNHPYTIICGDTLMIDSRHSNVDSKIWSLGNQWDPPSISDFYIKIEPPFKFSLAELAKTAKPPQPVTVTTEPGAFSLAELVRSRKKQT